MSTPFERPLYASPSSSAASTPQEQQQQQGHFEIVPTTPSVPSATLIVDSLALTSVGSSSATSSSSALLTLLHSPTSIFQQQWPQQHPTTVVPWPTPSPPSSPTVTPQTTASGPPLLPSSTMTSADHVGSSSSSSSSILALSSFSYDQPSSSLAPLVLTNLVLKNVPMEPSFKDPALAERYWNYDHQNISLSDAVAAERAFGAAPKLVKRRLGSREQPPWFWGQNSSTCFTWIKSEDIDQEEENVCSICLEEFKERQLCCFLLRCFHSFHCPCLLKWWVHGQQKSCPLCRSIVPDLPNHLDV